jgi:nucleotide-binding universal stress UspA family protein
MFRRILVATDCEDGLDRFTQCLTSLYQSGVEFVGFVHSLDWQEDAHGIPEDMAPEIESSRAALLQRCMEIPEGMQVDVVVRVGKPADVIQQAIEQLQPDVLIQGMAIRNLLLEKVFGSTTMELIPRLRIPVLVVRPQLVATFTLEELQLRCQHLFRTILIPCDFSEASQQLLQAVVDPMQAHNDSQVHSVLVVHVVDPSTRQNQSRPVEDLQQYYQDQLQEWVEPFRQAAPQVEIMTQVRTGAPVKEILLAAGEADATAIATASRSAGSFWEWSIRSTTGEILRKSWHSVLFFPFHKPES